jgi:hypothetical protein
VHRQKFQQWKDEMSVQIWDQFRRQIIGCSHFVEIQEAVLVNEIQSKKKKILDPAN